MAKPVGGSSLSESAGRVVRVWQTFPILTVFRRLAAVSQTASIRKGWSSSGGRAKPTGRSEGAVDSAARAWIPFFVTTAEG